MLLGASAFYDESHSSHKVEEAAKEQKDELNAEKEEANIEKAIEKSGAAVEKAVDKSEKAAEKSGADAKESAKESADASNKIKKELDESNKLKIEENAIFMFCEDIPQLYVTTINTIYYGRTLSWLQVLSPMGSFFSIVQKQVPTNVIGVASL